MLSSTIPCPPLHTLTTHIFQQNRLVRRRVRRLAHGAAAILRRWMRRLLRMQLSLRSNLRQSSPHHLFRHLRDQMGLEPRQEGGGLADLLPLAWLRTPQRSARSSFSISTRTSRRSLCCWSASTSTHLKFAPGLRKNCTCALRPVSAIGIQLPRESLRSGIRNMDHMDREKPRPATYESHSDEEANNKPSLVLSKYNSVRESRTKAY